MNQTKSEPALSHRRPSPIPRMPPRPLKAFIPVAITIATLLQLAQPARAQLPESAAAPTPPAAHGLESRVMLPASPAAIDQAMDGLGKTIAEIRHRLAASPGANAAAGDSTTAPAAGAQESARLLQQWIVALDQRVRHLAKLKELRHQTSKHTAERDAWQGFALPPTAAATEELADLMSAQQREQEAGRLFLAIVQGEIARHAARLTKTQKELRLHRDRADATWGRPALTDASSPIESLRRDVSEAALETAEFGRLLASESLEENRRQLDFLQTKLAAARAQARLGREDLAAVIAQINEKRLALQQELQAALAADATSPSAPSRAPGQATTPPEPAADPQLAQVQHAQTEARERQIETLRGFLQLADHAQEVWEDRFWLTTPRPIRDLQARQAYHAQRRATFQQWKFLIEQSLSAASQHALQFALKTRDHRISTAEQHAALRLQEIWQERAALDAKCVGALVFAEELTGRLLDELAMQIRQRTLAGRFLAGLDEAGAFLRRVWNVELYVAEDSAIVSGQKVSIPRSITLGKVATALAIFALGLCLAIGAFRLVARLATRPGRHGERSSETFARVVAAAIAAVSLVVAMASVRIPWTVFAFLGGALAIGVGFGAQALINNFISGVILLCERNLRVGDIVEIDQYRGKISQIGLRNSLVTRSDGIDLLVPNSQFLEQKVVNWTLRNDLVRYTITVGVAYGAPVRRAAQLMAQAATENRFIQPTPEPAVLLDDFGDNALVFSLQFWMRVQPGVDGGTVRSELRHRIYELFNAENITIAFPQRDLHLETSRPLEFTLVDPPSPPRVPSLNSGHAPARPTGFTPPRPTPATSSLEQFSRTT